MWRKAVTTGMMMVSAVYRRAGAIDISPETGPWSLTLRPSQRHSARNDKEQSDHSNPLRDHVFTGA